MGDIWYCIEVHIQKIVTFYLLYIKEVQVPKIPRKKKSLWAGFTEAERRGLEKRTGKKRPEIIKVRKPKGKMVWRERWTARKKKWGTLSPRLGKR